MASDPRPVGHLVDRHPTVSPERLIAQLVVPPTFTDVSFESYRPDPAEPTQAAAVQACLAFCDEAVRRRAGRKKLFGRRETLPGVGLYLDGGFGVGKTHLLASAYRRLPDSAEHPKAFATFGELTQLASVFGFVECIDLLADYVLVCIDEFELDDPGNTTLISGCSPLWWNRASRSPRRPTRCPSSWAKRRFRGPGLPARDQHAGKHFHHRADRGPDYRHRGLPPAPGTALQREVAARAAGVPAPPWTTSTHCAGIWPPCTRRGTRTLIEGCRRSISPACTASTTRMWRCGWYRSPTGSTTPASRWWHRGPARHDLLRGDAGRRLPQKYLRATSRLLALTSVART